MRVASFTTWKKMTVKMLRQCIAGKAPRKSGEVLEVSTDEGKILIAAGDAAEHKQAVKGRPKKDGS